MSNKKLSARTTKAYVFWSVLLSAYVLAVYPVAYYIGLDVAKENGPDGNYGASILGAFYVWPLYATATLISVIMLGVGIRYIAKIKNDKEKLIVIFATSVFFIQVFIVAAYSRSYIALILVGIYLLIALFPIYLKNRLKISPQIKRKK